MAQSDVTRPSLLVRIRDAHDREAWDQFVEIYAPLVYQMARRRGLQDADAADLTQDVLRSISGAVGRLDYDRCRGTFRSWLFTVIPQRATQLLRRPATLAARERGFGCAGVAGRAPGPG
jgi:RNA polymerase sigma-70 factor (ECF subfamily)